LLAESATANRIIHAASPKRQSRFCWPKRSGSASSASGNAIGSGPASDTGPFDHFAFLVSDFQGVKSTLNNKGVKYRENHIASPPIDQLFFPDNNNVMGELNFPRD
jgi:hypothetical protein